MRLAQVLQSGRRDIFKATTTSRSNEEWTDRIVSCVFQWLKWMNKCKANHLMDMEKQQSVSVGFQ